MAIISISRIQHRRGLKSDLPTALAEGELGWCLDTRELFIGNSEGYGFNTQILTEWSRNDQIIRHKFNPPDTSLYTSTNRPIGSKLNDIVSIKDFGVFGDGNTDDTDAINAAIAELFKASTDLDPADMRKHVTLYFPAGVYKITKPILMYPYVTIAGDGIDKTIIRCGDPEQTVMLTTADSLGNTGANIGLVGYFPKYIEISNLTIDANGNYTDLVKLVRYSFAKIDSVKFVGPYLMGDLLSNSPTKALSLQSIGNVSTTANIEIVDCIFTKCAYGIWTEDPIKYTKVSRCTFTEGYSGITLLSTNFGGPYYTSLTQSNFYKLDETAITSATANPGIVSVACSFERCNLKVGVSPVVYEPGSSLNGSIGDVFDVYGITDNGDTSIILNAQHNNITAQGSVQIATTSTYTVENTDTLVIAKNPIPSPVTINLPASPIVGHSYTIKDGMGNASTYNITLTPASGTIDGNATAVITIDWASVTVVFDGTSWSII